MRSLIAATILVAMFASGCGSSRYIGRTGGYPDAVPTCVQALDDGRSVQAIFRDLGADAAAMGFVDGAETADHLEGVVAPILAADTVPISAVDSVVLLVVEAFNIEDADDDLVGNVSSALAAIIARHDTPAGGDIDPELQHALQWAVYGLGVGLREALPPT